MLLLEVDASLIEKPSDTSTLDIRPSVVLLFEMKGIFSYQASVHIDN